MADKQTGDRMAPLSLVLILTSASYVAHVDHMMIRSYSV